MAYAHGIKTISYKNNKCVDDIVKYIRFISKSISSYSEADQIKVIDDIFDKLIRKDGSIIDFSVLPVFSFRRRCPKSIKTSILGTTSTGLAIHLISNDSFPDELFKERDFIYCRVKSTDDYDKWLLEFKESKFVLYFSMPEIIKAESFAVDGGVVYPRKQKELETIYFDRYIDGKQRRLEFRFDNEWFQTIANKR